MASSRGKLIVFEGLDRSGKSTQCARLVEHLRQQGQKVESMRFPNRTTPIGQMIDRYLNGATQQEDHVIHLLFSANRWESAGAVEDFIRDGVTVIIDRYYYSGCVYSAAKQNPSLSLEWCREPEVGLPRPDVCLFLGISAEEAAKRDGFGTERYEKRAMQDRVRQLFEDMAKHRDEGEDMVYIDASRSTDAVAEAIRAEVQSTFERVDSREIPLRHVRPWPAVDP